MVVGFGGPFQDNARTALFQGYAKATNQTVKDDVYNGEMAKVYSMVKSSDVTYDVIMVEAPELVRGCEDGVFEKMDWNVVKRDKFISGGTYDVRRRRGAVGRHALLRSRQGAERPRHVRQAVGREDVPRQAPAAPVAQDDARDRAARRRRSAGRRLQGARARPRDRSARSTSSTRSSRNLMWWKSGTQPVQMIASGDATYAVGFTGRIVRANEGGAKYPLLWKTLLYSVDYWAVVKGSPNAKEGMKMIEWITDTKPLLALADIYAVSPANKEAAANPALSAKNPGMLRRTCPTALFINTEFWVANGEDLEQKFNAWLAK